MRDARTSAYVVLALSGLALLRHYRNVMSRRKLCHPPSPKSYPLLGNLLSIPPGPEHLAYMKLGEQLNSDIIFLKVFGHSIIILNSAQAASDLLDKRSARYADRYCPPMIKEPSLVDWSTIPSLVEYGDVWRHYRRLMNNWLNSRAVGQFNKLQENQTRLLLKRLLELSSLPAPFEQVRHEFFFTMASSMFQLGYGYTLQGDQDPFFLRAQSAIDQVTEAGMFTNFFVNILPILNRVPDWFPGTGWKQTARTWRANKERAVDEPYEWTKAQVESGTASPSILSALLQGHSLTSDLCNEEKEKRLKQLAIVMFAGGTDTTSNVLVVLAAAMVLHPLVQERAQKEIDTILGPGVLPTMSDRQRLPYIDNVILELLRWHPVTPTGVAHRCFEDDVYRGYNIEKGSIVIGNLWAMSRDESFYKDPNAFNPDRFLDPKVPPLPGFGWGRRCPGIYFADASLFLGVTSLLATFSFLRKKDAQGNEIIPKIEPTHNSIVMGLNPFEFEFRPRSEKHRQLILESVQHM
ncbi:Cytochrome P450 family protein [Ceratobasidium theobromae]|uniref:Cytochrome P450 family protein n=1 Tax=Ceratobasidium theobromae TaxID=1582974 RepID=A0A5N5QKJ0_9AGAM|nr:Cytochrome P450 family protein [Ceratobasidium theobromae]